jgi:hypothetical protein
MVVLVSLFVMSRMVVLVRSVLSMMIVVVGRIGADVMMLMGVFVMMSMRMGVRMLVAVFPPIM